MIIEEIIHTESEDIPKDYCYDTETPDFYVYRHKYTGKEIHIVKNPKTYINIQSYINKVLDKIRSEIEQLRLHKAQFLTNDNKVCIDSQEVLNILDKYKSESEDNQVGCIFDEPLKPYICEADWNCKDCPNWRDEKADKEESEGEE